VDLTDAATRLKPRVAKAVCEDTWVDAAERWAALKEADGGHPIAVVETKLRDLATALGVDYVVARLDDT